MAEIKDSGNRREFETGAVRDMAEGKGRCDLLPLGVLAEYFHTNERATVDIFTRFDAFLQTRDVGYLYDALNLVSHGWMFPDVETMVLEVAKHFEDGCRKYGENNWKKGIPVTVYVDSAIRHFMKYCRGDDDERHDRAFCWNVLCCAWTVENANDLNTSRKIQPV